MSVEIILSLIAGAAAGGFINGLAGFGTALLSLSIWLQVLPPWQAVAMAAVMSVVSGVQGVWTVRHDVRHGTRRLCRFLIPAVASLPLGILSLGVLNASMLKLVIAGSMLLYGVLFSFRRTALRIEKPMPLGDVLIGFSGGFLGGAASLSGVLPTMWCAMQPWTKGETSAVLRPFNMVILAIAITMFAWHGFYSRETLIMMAIALPATIISAQFGIAVFKRLTDQQFRQLLVWVLFASGILMAGHELLLIINA